MQIITLIFLFISLLPRITSAIQCYSSSQLQIVECPSLSCIKQSLGLDTARYCDGTGVSSICQTYRIFDSCQNMPNLGYICCCSEQLCNTALVTAAVPFITIMFIIILSYYLT